MYAQSTIAELQQRFGAWTCKRVQCNLQAAATETKTPVRHYCNNGSLSRLTGHLMCCVCAMTDVAVITAKHTTQVEGLTLHDAAANGCNMTEAISANGYNMNDSMSAHGYTHMDPYVDRGTAWR